MAEIWFVKREVLPRTAFGMWRLSLNKAPRFPEEYYLAAEIRETGPDDCFSYLQNRDDSWSDNKHIIAYVNNDRSMSVDDVVIEDGRAFRCASIGWEEIAT